MTILATVLYEDKMLPNVSGDYPLHDLVMRMVEDEINGQTWRLRTLIAKNPRKGIGNVISDLPRTELIAGAGNLYLLVDRDRIAENLGLGTAATDDEVLTNLAVRSNGSAKLHPYFLRPNLEGLLRDIQRCEPALLPGNIQAALQKRLNDRDIVLTEVGKAARADIRKCMRQAQPGLDALVMAIASLIPREAIA